MRNGIRTGRDSFPRLIHSGSVLTVERSGQPDPAEIKSSLKSCNWTGCRVLIYVFADSQGRPSVRTTTSSMSRVSRKCLPCSAAGKSHCAHLRHHSASGAGKPCIPVAAGRLGRTGPTCARAGRSSPPRLAVLVAERDRRTIQTTKLQPASRPRRNRVRQAWNHRPPRMYKQANGHLTPPAIEAQLIGLPGAYR